MLPVRLFTIRSNYAERLLANHVQANLKTRLFAEDEAVVSG